jgi:BON domain
MINRPWLNKAFPLLMLSAGLLAVSGGSPLFAQDNAAQGQTAQGQPTDGQIEMDVVKALDASSALKNDLITAATIQSEVTLSGTVSDQAAKDLAASIVSHVAGVTKVHNNLQIGNPEQAAQNEQLPMNDESAPAPADQNQDQAPMPSQEQGSMEQGSGDQGPSNQGSMPPPAAQPQGPNAAPAPYPGTDQGAEQGQYPPPPPPYRNQYPQQYPPQYPAQQPRYDQAKGPVTIPAGTLLQVRTNEPVDSKRAAAGTPVQFTVIQDVSYGGVLAIPRGATVHGVITDVKKAGELGGNAELALRLTSLDLGGQSYPIESDLFKVKGPNKAGETVNNAVGGALLGAIIGGIAGRGAGAAIGAGAGAAAGTAATAATPGPRAWIPAEALVTFHLAAPVTVAPVSPQEAARLAEGLYPGGPTLYRRGYYPYGPYPYARYAGGPYGPYAYGPYAYPPVYYRPYYMVGGVYYWR